MRKIEHIVELNKLIGANLREIRDDLEMTQNDVGAMLDVSAQQYRKYESGQNHLAASQLAVLLVAGWPADRIFRGIQTIVMVPEERRQAVQLLLETVAESKRPQYGEMAHEG